TSATVLSPHATKHRRRRSRLPVRLPRDLTFYAYRNTAPGLVASNITYGGLFAWRTILRFRGVAVPFLHCTPCCSATKSLGEGGLSNRLGRGMGSMVRPWGRRTLPQVRPPC